MLLRLSRSNFAVKSTSTRLFSSVKTSYAIKETAEKSSSSQITKDPQSSLPIFENALKFSSKIAVKDQNAEYSYKQLLSGAAKISEVISSLCGNFRFPNFSFRDDVVSFVYERIYRTQFKKFIIFCIVIYPFHMHQR